VALAAITGAVAGGLVVHARDQRQAAGDLYRAQVLSTLTRFLGAEHQLLAQPLAQRDAGTLSDLADSITADTGINGVGTLSVEGPCPASFWSPGSDPTQPRFGLAGIRRLNPV
jgi:hypothetical protein